MFDSIRGRVIRKLHTLVTVETFGVGWKINVPLNSIQDIKNDSEITLFVHLHIGQNDIRFFGFLTIDERDFFQLLLTVNGVGPATALSILSTAKLDDIKSAIRKGEIGFLKTIKGIGPKTAQRIIVELREAVDISFLAKDSAIGGDGYFLDAVEALVSLGQPRNLAQQSVKKAFEKIGKDTKLEDLIKTALQTK
jgi:Holliday junction DNA helicase RuvA